MTEETIVQKKIGKLVQVELSIILQREAWIKNALITLSVVRMTRDLEIAKIYVSVLPETMHQEVVDFLNKNNWEARKLLSARLKNQLRKMPEIRFFVDDSLAEAAEIEKLISSLNIQKEETL